MSVGRRLFLQVTAIAALIELRVDAFAQPQRAVVRIGYLTSGSAESTASLTQTFLQGLRALGYVDGDNLLMSYRFAGGNAERLPELAGELVQMKPDLIFVVSAAAALAAKHATASIPIVMVSVADPVGIGLVASLARPGGNITGISGQYEDVAQKMLELLKAAVPKASHVALLVNLNPATLAANYLKASHDAAQALGLRASNVEVHGPSDLDGAFAAIMQDHPDALIHLPSPLFFGERKRIADFAVKSRLPTIGPWREFPEAGGLMSYGYKIDEGFTRATIYVDKILKGAKPADLPIEQPTQFELAINLKTAKMLGIAIPKSVLLRADEVIE